MRSKLFTAGMAILALGLAACGSSSKSSGSTSGSSSTPSSTSHTHGKKGRTTHSGVRSRTYRLKLNGKAEIPSGAPKGTGAAVIALHGNTLKVCFRFAHLKGFTGATYAHIHLGAKGTSGNVVVPLSTGAKFLHKGCVSASASLIKAIEKNPHGYYVNIHSKKYPAGVVRSQL
jgi:hypothetical protein